MNKNNACVSVNQWLALLIAFTFFLMFIAYQGPQLRDTLKAGKISVLVFLAIFLILFILSIWRILHKHTIPHRFRFFLFLLLSIPYIFGISIFLELQFSGETTIEWIHWAIFAGGSFVLTVLCPYEKRFLLMVWIGFLLIEIDELFQALLPFRVGDIRDVLLDISAWVLGVVLAGEFVSNFQGDKRRRPFSMMFVLIWVSVLLLSMVTYDVLVGFQTLPYPKNKPVVRLYSRFSGGHQNLRAVSQSGIFRLLVLHELKRWKSLQQKSEKACSPVVAEAIEYYSEASDGVSDSLPAVSRISCAVFIPFSYRFVSIMLFCGILLTGFVFIRVPLSIR